MGNFALFGERKFQFGKLCSIRDHYPKRILTLDRYTTGNYDGIRVENVVDWLLNDAPK